MTPEALREHFLRQADGCQQLGSLFTARLCRALPDLLDDMTETGRRVLNWPGDPRPGALALRLCGALHHLVLSGADEALAVVYPPATVHDGTLATALKASIRRNDAAINRFLDSPPQTNEVGRSGMLLPGFLTIARETGLPLAVHEIGASAGLNLQFDRFHYRYDGAEWGDPASPAQLAPEIRGVSPRLDGDLTVVSRSGCDIAPIDISNPAARLRLRSYIWPDQPLRLERLNGALELAKANPPALVAKDAATFVRDALAGRKPGEAFVLFHSIMWQYMPAATQAAIADLLEQAGGDAVAGAPIAWLHMEPNDTRDPHAMLTLTLWPSGETRKLARCDYHGRWIEWIDGAVS